VDDRPLIARVLAGDRVAGRELYDAHVHRVYRLVFRLVGGDEDLARDFTQETFIRAFDRLGAFRGDASFSTWVHSIAVSVSLNGLRRQRRFRIRETGFDEAPAGALAASEPDGDLRTRLQCAIDDLGTIYRTVVIMHDIEGYTHAEIGQILGVPEGTSKARLSAARAKLRTALADLVEDRRI
jgi:RNA polymerase sigma-70 factor, ECF subfamily